MVFYPYRDPFNTVGYAEVMRENGSEAIACEKTFLYVRKTLMGKIGQVFYPAERVDIPADVGFCEMRGLLEPLPNAATTRRNNIVHVKLNRPSTSILDSLDKQRRWGIRKALERGAHAYVADTRDAFKEFWEIYQATSKRRGFLATQKEFVEKVFGRRDLARLFIVEAKNHTAGAYLTLFSEDSAKYFLGGYSEAFREYHPNELGHYSIIRYFHEKGLEVYNLGGAGRVPREGDFKIGWGELIPVFHCQLYSSRILAEAVRGYRKARRLRLWLGKRPQKQRTDK